MKKIYYIINSLEEDCQIAGLLSFLLERFQQVLFAVDHGLIPIFDTYSCSFPLFADGTDNPFYSYFKAIDGEPTIEEVYGLPKEQRIMGYPAGGFATLFEDYYIDLKGVDWINESVLSVASPVFNKYCALNDNVQELVDKLYEDLFPKNGKVLGVNIRTAYKYVSILDPGKYGYHPRILEFNELYEIVMKRMPEWGYEYLYLIVDDREYLENMKRLLGDKLIYVERPIYNMFESGEIIRDDDRVYAELDSTYNKTRIFLAQTELLAMCDSLIYTSSSSSIYSLLRRGTDYEYVDVYDLGVYSQNEIDNNM